MAQNISGIIQSKSDGDLLKGAAIKIAGTTKGTVTNGSGKFKLNDISQGTIRLTISHTGFTSIDTSFYFSGKEVIALKFQLVSSNE